MRPKSPKVVSGQTYGIQFIGPSGPSWGVGRSKRLAEATRGPAPLKEAQFADGGEIKGAWNRKSPAGQNRRKAHCGQIWRKPTPPKFRKPAVRRVFRLFVGYAPQQGLLVINPMKHGVGKDYIGFFFQMEGSGVCQAEFQAGMQLPLPEPAFPAEASSPRTEKPRSASFCVRAPLPQPKSTTRPSGRRVDQGEEILPIGGDKKENDPIFLCISM